MCHMSQHVKLIQETKVNLIFYLHKNKSFLRNLLYTKLRLSLIFVQASCANPPNWVVEPAFKLIAPRHNGCLYYKLWKISFYHRWTDTECKHCHPWTDRETMPLITCLHVSLIYPFKCKSK
jgi:hypothetical protein